MSTVVKAKISKLLDKSEDPGETLDYGYNKQLELNHFDLLIDWGWFYFITKPMFLALDFFYHLFGNFGISILLVTVLVKLLFFAACQ